MRMVEMVLTKEFTEIAPRHESELVLGQMLTWNVLAEQYGGRMTIFGSKDGNLYATYRNTNHIVTHSCCAILEDDQYIYK